MREGLQGDPGAAEVRVRGVPLRRQAALPYAVPRTQFSWEKPGTGARLPFLQHMADGNGLSPKRFPPGGGCSDRASNQTNQPPPKKKPKSTTIAAAFRLVNGTPQGCANAQFENQHLRRGYVCFVLVSYK